jgi:chromosome partitioning protein
MPVYAVANNKGGVGKTTVAVNLAATFAREGHPTLLIDLDPQGNAGIHLGIQTYELERSMRDVMLGTVDLASIIWESDFANLDIAPANLLLDEVEMSSAPGKEMALKAELDSVKSEYEYIFIDCPPRLGLFSTSALVASDKIILPIQAAHFALEGTSQILWMLDMVRKRFGKEGLEILRVIPMMYRRTSLADEIMEEIHKHFAGRVTRPVPVNVAIDEASAQGKPVVYYAPQSKGAQAFEEIARDLLDHAQA